MMLTRWRLYPREISKLAVLLLGLMMILIVLNASSIQAHRYDENRPQSQTADVPQHTLLEDIETMELVNGQKQKSHRRRKRLIWITDDGRLALPPGTTLSITPTISLPLVRHPPEGFLSNLSINFPITIDFDKLGLTDNQNPLGDLPPIFARSFGYATGEILSNYLRNYLHRKRKRDLADQQQMSQQPIKSRTIVNESDAKSSVISVPDLPEHLQHAFHGGERIMLYSIVEDFLSTFGMNGHACLLRTICEIHSRDLQNFGVFGEMIKLFLTVTNSPFSDLTPDYVKAQQIGEGRIAPAECFPYYKECPKGIFKALKAHNYRSTEDTIKNEYYQQDVQEVEKSYEKENSPENVQHLDDIEDNEIDGKSLIIEGRSSHDYNYAM